MEMVIMLEIGYMLKIMYKQLTQYFIKEKLMKHIILVDLMNGKTLILLE